jgi:hypothetical protein
MGLTIHYALHSDTRSAKEARRLVEDLRKRALDLSFAEVREVVELKGDACQFDRYGQDHPHRWLLVQAGQYVEREHVHYSVMPKHVVAFSAWPGEGCEEANFGLLCDLPHNSPSVAQLVMWPAPFLRQYFSVSPVFCAT